MDNKRTGLIALVTALAVFGGTIAISPTEAGDAYYCSLTDEVAVFERLSASMKTGYYLVDGEEQSLACKIGNSYEPWVSLKQYLEENGISWEEFLNQDAQNTVEVTKVRGTQGEFLCEYNVDGVLETYSKCYQGGVFKVYAGELICPA